MEQVSFKVTVEIEFGRLFLPLNFHINRETKITFIICIIYFYFANIPLYRENFMVDYYLEKYINIQQ